MTTRSDEPTDPPALAALTKLGSDGVQRPARAELDRGLYAVLARIATSRARRRGLVRWSLVGVTATLLLLAVLQVASVPLKSWFAPDPPALAYQIEGGSVLEGGRSMFDGHSGTFLVDRTEPPTCARSEHELAPLVEKQLDARVAGLA